MKKANRLAIVYLLFLVMISEGFSFVGEFSFGGVFIRRRGFLSDGGAFGVG